MSARNIYEVFSPAFALFFTALSMLVAVSIVGGHSYRTLRIDDASYKMTVADSDVERGKGLSGREYLPENEGMLFVYEHPGKRCFWMKDMQLALDIVWVNAAKKALHIEHTVMPETYPKTYCPDVPATYVLELPAGQAAKHHLQNGDTLTF